MWGVPFFLLLSRLCLILWVLKFECNVSWWGPLWIHSGWNPLSFLYWELHFLPQIWKVCNHYFFKWTHMPSCFHSSPRTSVMCVFSCLTVSHVSLHFIYFPLFFFFLLLLYLFPLLQIICLQVHWVFWLIKSAIESP